MADKNSKAPKRVDSKGRILKDNEMQRPDGRYMFAMVDPVTGKRKYIYSWKLEKNDKMPAGKKPDKSLREKIKELEVKKFVGVAVDGGGLTVADLVDRYLSTKRNVRPSTKAGYRTVQNWLKKDPFGKKRIDKVNADIAKQWLISLQTEYGKSFSSIHSIRGVVKPAFDYAVEADLLFKNPFKFELAGVLVDDSVKREAVSKADERRFLEFIKDDPHFSRYYDGIFILFNTGLRIGELCGLTLNDVDLDKREIKVDHQLQYNSRAGKGIFYGVGQNDYEEVKFRPTGGKKKKASDRSSNKGVRDTKTKAGNRVLPMSEEVYEAFKRVVENRKAPAVEEVIEGYSGFLFLDDKGKAMVGYQWEKKFAGIIEKYNKIYKDELPKITPHMCRHTYCTRLASNHVSVQTIKYLMGHNDIQTSMRYTHLGKDEAKEDLRRAEAIADLERVKAEQRENKDKGKIINVDFGLDRMA